MVGQRRLLEERIEEMQRTLDRLDGKIERYEVSVLEKEKRLKKE